MKALTLDQPYATLAAIGAKKWETRSWQPYGISKNEEFFAIHATARYSDLMQEIENFAEFQHALRGISRPLPVGQIIAVATIARVISTGQWIKEHCRRQLVEKWDAEYSFGDYGPGRWAWELKKVQQLKTPITCPGRQKLWTLPAEIEERVLQQIGVAA